MNDAMKLALGVTGFASLLALAIPANFDVADDQKEQAIPAPTPPPGQPATVPATVNAEPQIIAEDDEDEDFSFGDPTASTDPIGFEETDNGENSDGDSLSSPVPDTAPQQASNREAAANNAIRAANNARREAQAAANQAVQSRAAQSSQSAPAEGSLVQSKDGLILVE